MLENEGMTPKYSIVVPLHNEQESARELYRRLAAVVTGRNGSLAPAAGTAVRIGRAAEKTETMKRQLMFLSWSG